MTDNERMNAHEAIGADIDYAIRQLASVSCKVPANCYDPIRRALDALERIQNALRTPNQRRDAAQDERGALIAEGLCGQ